MQDGKVNRNEQFHPLVHHLDRSSAHPLVFFPGSLGDVLCLLPALKAITEAENKTSLEVVARTELFPVLRCLPFVQRVVSIEQGIFSQLFSQSPSGGEALSTLFPSVSTIFSWFGHNSPEVKINLNYIIPGRVRSFAFFTGQEDCHASAYYLRCVGIEELRSPSLRLGEEERRWAERYWDQHGYPPSSRLLVVHPGSGGKKKRWDQEGFVQISRWWREQQKGAVLILLGPAEQEEAKRWREVAETKDDLSLLQVAALLSRADAYLGNDSGLSHLAGAVGARGVVLFGPTSSRQWRPLGGALSVLRNESYRERNPGAPGISLTEIAVEAVQTALVRV
jgi:ADP-heptose:LPS heptosyltransferase